MWQLAGLRQAWAGHSAARWQHMSGTVSCGHAAAAVPAVRAASSAAALLRSEPHCSMGACDRLDGHKQQPLPCWPVDMACALRGGGLGMPGAIWLLGMPFEESVGVWGEKQCMGQGPVA